ncbi:MAG: hypothetical protein D6812_08450, partial [Deltaproteobacteria bacterium]
MMRKMLRCGILALLALLLPRWSAWAEEGSAVTKVAEIEGITEYRLGNGLQILLFPDATNPRVT